MRCPGPAPIGSSNLGALVSEQRERLVMGLKDPH